MSDSGAFAGVILIVASGVVALYYRLRLTFDRTTSSLSVVLLAGATPLLNVISQQRVVEGSLFAGLAFLACAVASRSWQRSIHVGVLGAASLIVPMIAPEESARPTLFASTNGLLSLTPVAYLAAIGLVASLKAHRAECVAVLLAFVLWPLLRTSLVPSVAFLAPGLAAAVQFARRHPLVAVAPLVLGAVVWNYWLMVQYTVGSLPKDAPVRFAAMVRQQADVHTRAPYIYPFAFPANLFEAWREGIPVGRYDALSVEGARDTFEMTIDTRADRFLLEGWGPLGASHAGPFRTIGAGGGRLLFPLRAGDGAVELLLVASVLGSGVSDTEAEVEVNGHFVGRFRVGGAGTSEMRLRIPSADAGRVLRAGYNRLLIVPSTPARIALHRLRVAPTP